MTRRWKQLNRDIVTCERCPRLLEHCRQVAVKKRRAYADDNYWGKPVPNFGDARAGLLIVGLAPGAHGANRTGRMFTGDRSGDWLYRALHKAGFATQPEATGIDDGQQLRDCAITNACHCAPPDNKPLRDEIQNCDEWFDRLLSLLPLRVIVALGGIAWRAVMNKAVERGWHEGKRPAFGHGAEVSFTGGLVLIGCYHPSQQNTFTGRLTEPMIDSVFAAAREKLSAR